MNWLRTILIGAVLSCQWGQPAVAEPVQFYYFNPDSPQSNLSLLKQAMDQLLTKLDQPITFQPFAHLIDFEREVKRSEPSFLFIPDWYVRENGSLLRLHRFLAAERNGQTHYYKQLITKKDAPFDLATLHNRSLAMTTLGKSGHTALNQLLFADLPQPTQNLNIMTVPKDADAIFAVALGQIDMALVSDESINYLRNVNPQIIISLHTIKQSKPIVMPVLCYLPGKSTVEQRGKLKQQLIHATQAKRHTIMEMLHITGWRTDE